jgi:hypothetical protein
MNVITPFIASLLISSFVCNLFAGAANPRPTSTPAGAATPCDQYTITQIGGSIVPGTMDIGNHGDDDVTTVALPFSYSLYGTTYTSVSLSSNGNAQFTNIDALPINLCLPSVGHDHTIFPYWDDLMTDAEPGCSREKWGRI